MSVNVGDRIPDAKLFESLEFGEACPVAPSAVSVADATKEKRLLVDDGVITRLNVEEPKKFGVSDAQSMLKSLG